MNRIDPAELQQYDQITAEFRPHPNARLKPGVSDCIGMITDWCAAWMIEDGEFAGQWAMTPMVTELLPYAWVPSGDLVRVGGDQI